MLFPFTTRFQVRYGEHWAAMHPDEPVGGVMTEILLGPEETLIELQAAVGDIIDAMQFTSNVRTYPRAGEADPPLTTSVPLNGLLYFSGASRSHGGVRVSQIVAQRKTCGAL